MASFLNSIGVFEQLTFLTIAVIHVVCAVYLFRRYLQNRENLTLIFVTFFAVMPAFWIVNFLTAIGILNFSVTVTLEYTYLIGTAILAFIGLVLLGVKQLYSIPLLLTILAYVQQTQMDSKMSTMTNLLHVIYLYFTGRFISDPWFVALKILFPNFLMPGQQISTILNFFYDPLAQPPTIMLGIYLALIVFPTTFLFYILAWKNRSGRSLGFALGLTIFILVGFMTASSTTVPRDLYNILTLIASGFFALGILGVLDKIIMRRESPNVSRELKRKA
ncbi:MAG: hypothetical protein QXO71_09100 [Candidatus Jordarchaeaceae archaeon]